MNMSVRKKKIFNKVVLFLVGTGIGWGGGEYRSRRLLDHLRQTWSPEFQEFISESVRVGGILNEISTEEDLQNLMMLNGKMYSDWNSQLFAKACYSLIIKEMLEEGKVEAAISFSESRLELFLERYDAGRFEGDVNAKVAGRLAEVIRKRGHEKGVRGKGASL